MICRCLAALLIVLFSCAEAPTEPTENPMFGEGGLIQLHIEAEPESDAAQTFQHEGETLYVGPEQEVLLSSVRRTQDGSGFPALSFDVAPSDQDRFAAICKQAFEEDRRVLFAVDGKPLSYPTMNAPLRIGGVIEAGAGGFTEAELTELLVQLTPQTEASGR